MLQISNEELYSERLARYVTAMHNGMPDRVPLRPFAAEITARQAAGEICVGPEMKPVLFPSAAMVARLATGRTDFVPGEKLEPVYLRAISFVKAAPGRVY